LGDGRPGTFRRLLGCSAGALIVLAVLGPRAASGQWEVMAGGEVDSHDTGYTFLATGYSHPLTPRVSLVTRVSGSYLFYTSPLEDGEIRVRSPGVALLVGPRLALAGLGLTLMGGAQARTIERETTTPAGSVHERDEELGPVVNGTLWAQPYPRWSLLGIVNHDFVNDYTWARGGVIYEVTSPERPLRVGVGPEGIIQGNPDILSVQGGGTLEVHHRPSAFSLTIRLGYKRSTFDEQPSRVGPYWGISLSRPF
jgi:hypothetical protein